MCYLLTEQTGPASCTLLKFIDSCIIFEYFVLFTASGFWRWPQINISTAGVKQRYQTVKESPGARSAQRTFCFLFATANGLRAERLLFTKRP